MMREVAEHVTAARVPDTGHWIPEENPQALLEILLDLLSSESNR
jgi:pimeloyl-ACP methyl ester carboxylesterase